MNVDLAGLLEIIALALEDHQRIEPHHADLCKVCNRMVAALDTFRRS